MTKSIFACLIFISTILLSQEVKENYVDNKFIRFESAKKLKKHEKKILKNNNIDSIAFFGYSAFKFFEEKYLNNVKIRKETGKDNVSETIEYLKNQSIYIDKYVETSARRGELFSLFWLTNYRKINGPYDNPFLTSHTKDWIFKIDENNSSLIKDSVLYYLKNSLKFDDYLNNKYSLSIALRYFSNLEKLSENYSANIKLINSLQDSTVHYLINYLDKKNDKAKINDGNNKFLESTRANLRRIILQIEKNNTSFTSEVNQSSINLKEYMIDTLNLGENLLLFKPFIENVNGNLFLNYKLYFTSNFGDMFICNEQKTLDYKGFQDNVYKSKKSNSFLKLVLFLLNYKLINDKEINTAKYIDENLNILNEDYPEYYLTMIGKNGVVKENYSDNKFNNTQFAMKIYMNAFNLVNNSYDSEFNETAVNFLKCAVKSGSESAKVLLVYYYNYFIKIRDYNEINGYNGINWKNSKINKSSAIDSLIYYLNLDITKSKQGLFLYGVLKYNGEFINKSNEKGLELIKKAYLKGDPSAIYLLDDYPKRNTKLSEYFNINYPWDLSFPCKRSLIAHQMETFKGHIDERKNCNNYIRPDKIELKYLYPACYIKLALSDSLLLKSLWDVIIKSDLFCSDECKNQYEKDKESDYDAGNKNWERLMNEEVKCAACSNRLKLKNMLTIKGCNCLMKDSGRDIGVGFGSNIKVCSKRCEIDYCKSMCSENGYDSNY